MTGMLASVNSMDEALLVLNAKVDIIDLKQPAQGALGALDNTLIADIVKIIAGQRPVSATIGDLPMHPEIIVSAAKTMAATGIDYIKIGFFPGGKWLETINHLHALTRQGIKIIAVLFADTQPELDILEVFAKAGFSGVMLDTMDKQKGSLATAMLKTEIEQFVITARHHQLLCGLAGSLQEQDIAELVLLQPDYLGFRGALCAQHIRTSALDSNAVLRIKENMTHHLLSLPAATRNDSCTSLTLNSPFPSAQIKS